MGRHRTEPPGCRRRTYRTKDGGCLGRAIIAFIGYVGPSLFGLGAARLIHTGHIVAVLWLTLFLLVLLAFGLRWSFGVITVPLAIGLVYVVGRYTPAGVQIVAAYAIAWFLLLSGVRGILRRWRTGSGDGEKLQGLTGLPQFIWFGLWLAATLGAVAVGGKMLVMPI